MLTSNKRQELEAFSRDIRIHTIQQLAARGFGHVGGSMSIADLLSALYGEIMNVHPDDPSWPDRDYLVCSKGHAGPAVYAALALKGYFPMEWLETLNQPNTNLPSHCDHRKTPGIDMTTGSLGQGLSATAGIALANKVDGRNNYTYCIIGGGESQEGQNWEAILFAAQQKLDRLIVFVDNNQVQLDGPTAQVNNMESFVEKFHSFHWDAVAVDGHDCDAICQAVERAKANTECPSAIVLNTVKGKGCSFAEGVFNHHIPVTQEQAEQAIAALRASI